MTRKPNRNTWSAVNSTARRVPGAGSSRTDSRSLSPLSRGRLTPPLPEAPTRPLPYKQALVLAMTYCVGCSVSIQTRSGDCFEGILHTPGLVHSQVHFVLRKARKLKPEEGTGDLIERLVIPSSELLQVYARDLPVHAPPEVPSRPASSPILAFPIHDDAAPFKYRFGNFDDIAFLGDKDRERAGAGLYGRELQKWEPDAGGLALEFEDGDHEVGTWDQFAENERKFGVTTDFNMDLYTTPLEPEKSRYTLAQADKIARDIQSASSPNLHIQDERNQLDDSGISEEVLYSSVLTDSVAVQKLEPNGEMASGKAERGPLERGGGALEDKLSHSPPKSPVPPAPQQSSLHRGATRPLILSAHNSTGPMIITNPRPNKKVDVQGELFKVVRDVSSLKPIPHGSPLKTSPLVHDSDTFEALNLHMSSGRKPFLQKDREDFLRFKAEAAAAKKSNSSGQKSGTREETIAQLRQFKEKEKMSPSMNRKHSGSGRSDGGSSSFVKSPSGGGGYKDFTPVPTPSGLDRDSGFGSQILKPEDFPEMDEPLVDSGAGTEEDPDVLTQRVLPQVKTGREDGEEAEFGDDNEEENTGRGLNPHAMPFNPSQVQAFKNKSDSGNAAPGQSTSDGSLDDLSPPESPVLPPESPVLPETAPAVFNPENLEEFPPLPTAPVLPEAVMPPIPQPPQPAVLIRPQPPPPPPRVVTPPPPPQAAPPEHHPQPPMVVPLAPRAPHRQPNKPSPSPAACHTPHNPMHQDQHPSMIMNSPHLMMSVSQAGQQQPQQQSSGPPILPSNGPPQQPMMPPHMPPHMSGPMHVMPQQIAHYTYPSEMGGRMPMVYPYGAPVAPVPGPPAPPGQPNNPNNEQSVPHPSMVYHPYFSGVPSYHIPYHMPMMQPQMPHYVPMAPAPMTPQRPGSTPRPRPRRKQGTFFNYGPRRS